MFDQQTNFLEVSKKLRLAIVTLFSIGLFLLALAVYFAFSAINNVATVNDLATINHRQVLYNVKLKKLSKKVEVVTAKPVAVKPQIKKLAQTKPVAKSVVLAVKSAPAQPARPVVRVPAVPYCQNVNYLLPGSIDLSSRPAGLTHIKDPINYFRVYGRDTRTIQSQIWQCGVSRAIGKSHIYAISQSRMAFSYRVAQAESQCKLTAVKVGLRTKMTMPTWTADAYTPQTTKNSMSRFMAGLSVHENGHGQIDLQYANQILAALNSLKTDCGSINNQARSIIANLQQQLAAAQRAYEIRTNYGANQGGWL